MRTVPEDILQQLRFKLWAVADSLGWLSLSDIEKSLKYKQWTEDPVIGGMLLKLMQKGQIRVYLKDTIMKGYSRQRLSDSSRLEIGRAHV